MNVIKANYEIISIPDGKDILKQIEIAGRTCYKSEDKITNSSSTAFVTMLLSKGHLSVIEYKHNILKV
jgi:thymidylate synthase (FAD)